MKNLSQGVAMLLALLITGCDQFNQPKKIEGQVFIVLNNRDTVKLSMVPVHLITASNAAFVAAQVESEFRAVENLAETLTNALNSHQILTKEAESLSSVAAIKQNEADKIITQIEAAAREARENLAEFNRLAPTGFDQQRAEMRKNITSFNARYAIRKKESERLSEESKKIEEQATEKRNLANVVESKINEIGKKIEMLPSRVQFWERLVAKSIVGTVTDADGNFTLTLMSNTPVHVVAYASRKTLSESDEEYLWSVPVGNTGSRQFLNNGNMVNRGQ